VLRQLLRWPHWTRQIIVRMLTAGGRCRRFIQRNGTERRASASNQWPNDAQPLHFRYGRPPLVTSVTRLQYLWRGSHPMLSPVVSDDNYVRPSPLQLMKRLRLVSEVSLKSIVADSRSNGENLKGNYDFCDPFEDGSDGR